MKKLLLTIAAFLSLAFSTSAFAAPQADSCLKLICPNDYDPHANPNGYFNQDSLRIDSCTSSPTYLQIYAFRYFHISLPLGAYPFDRIIAKNEVKYTSDISNNFPDFKAAIQLLENKYGKFYFIRDGLIMVNQPDSSYIYSPRIGLYLDKYICCSMLKADFSKVQGIDRFSESYTGCGQFNVIVDEQAANLQSPSFTPNPVKSKLTLIFDRTGDRQKIKISNLMGILVKEIDFSKEIDVSELSAGIYFLQTNDKEFKFIKE